MTSNYDAWQTWLDQLKTKGKAQPELIHIIKYYAALIHSTNVGIYARMSYGVPFLYKYGPIGYFNINNGQVYFGFYWGKLLLESEGSELFVNDERKMVKLVYLNSLNENESFIGAFLLLLESALLVDEEKYGNKRR